MLSLRVSCTYNIFSIISNITCLIRVKSQALPLEIATTFKPKPTLDNVTERELVNNIIK